MAVATSIKGRKLEPYEVLRDDELQVFVTPELTTMARTMHVDVTRGFRKGLAVSFSNTLG